MMATAAILAAALVLFAASAARAERVTIAVSTPEVAIGSNFNGAPITVFGVIEGEAPGAAPTGPHDVAVVVLGPPETVVARRKDRFLGAWINRASETIVDAPAFYALNTSTELVAISTPATLDRLGLGLDNIPFTYEGRPAINDPAAAEFRAAYVRLKEKAGLFSQQVAVDFIGETIFRTTAWLPANVPVGRHTVLVYLFSANALIAHAEDSIMVSKTGVDQLVPTFARSESLIYGLLCAALAIFVGWLGGVIFRRD
jgi:uncharacterized protein (TIGR02186 family)